MGLIEKVNSDTLQISKVEWKITSNGRSFLRAYSKMNEKENYEVVMTIPPPFSKELTSSCKYIKKTDMVFKELFSKTQNEIKIFSPYIDASIVSFFQKIKPSVKIKIITLPSSYSGKNSIIERMKSTKDIDVRYILEKKEGAQIYQIHGKIIISDNVKIYIGSANFKETSIYYNLETGIVSNDEGLIEKYSKIFEEIFNNHAS
jgi:phosphatidylserine/phosphatidylglycerophosphate/cardiolipin synthase-like enzyme